MTYKNDQVIVTIHSEYPNPDSPVCIFPKKYNINPVSLAGYISNDTHEFYIELFGMTYGHLFLANEFMHKESDEPIGFVKFRVQAADLINRRNVTISINTPDQNFLIPIIKEKCEEVYLIISMIGIPFDGIHVPIYDCGEIKLMKPIGEICNTSGFDYVGNAAQMICFDPCDNSDQTEL